MVTGLSLLFLLFPKGIDSAASQNKPERRIRLVAHIVALAISNFRFFAAAYGLFKMAPIPRRVAVSTE